MDEQEELHGIAALLMEWIEVNGWPEEEIKIGPSTCGLRECKTKHAWARSVPFGDGSSHHAFVYERPCEFHAPMGTDRAKA